MSECASLCEFLPCGCLLGFRTGDEQHEEWCPAIRGDFDGLPIIVPDPNAPNYANGEVGDYA